jgi:hypothetical protein
MADPDEADNTRPAPTTAIAIAGIIATLIAAVASSAITGCQQSNLQARTSRPRLRPPTRSNCVR